MLPATKSRILLSLVLLVFSVLALPGLSVAQTDDTVALKAKGQDLIDHQRFTEALPIYEILVKISPKDPDVYRNLAFSLLGQSMNEVEEPARRQLRVRARDAFVLARDYGDKSLMVLGLIEGMAADGSPGKDYSDNAEANRKMLKAEAAFSSGKLEDAFGLYQEALVIDPRCYTAALFSGDVNLQLEKYDEAEKWYQKAISINQYIETAYRYSATPLMKQQKFDQARDRYVEAYIVEPYNNLAVSGISQWGQLTNTKLGHPRFDIPKITMGPDGKYNADIFMSPDPSDGSLAWMSYASTREDWRKEKFAKTYPNEKQYRHSLKEEADALRSVITSAKALKPAKLNPQIAGLAALDADGVLEAFILMAIPDSGIAQDQPAYLRANRDKLRLYVQKYVILK